MSGNVSSEITVGVDVSTHRIALADTLGRSVSVIIDQEDKGSRRLAWTFRQTEIATRQFCDGHDVIAVFVEAPAGHHVHPSLIEMCGVVKAAVYTALERIYEFPVSVLPITVGQWKRLTVGNGAAQKHDVWEWCAHRSDPANQDEADATAIAWAGRELLDGKS